MSWPFFLTNTGNSTNNHPTSKAAGNLSASALKTTNQLVFAARLDDEGVVGFTQLYRSYCSVAMQELIYLYDLFVAPDARRQGVARALMAAARQYAEGSRCGPAAVGDRHHEPARPSRFTRTSAGRETKNFILTTWNSSLPERII